MEISVIIPAYNVEKYIEKCLDSLFRQSFRDFEIIIIDDGSKDGTAKCVQRIIDKKENDIPVRFMKQENAGQSVTRNRGIGLAKGRYLSFIDSDDYVTEDYLERLYQAAKSVDADIAFCGYERVNDAGEVLDVVSIDSSAHYIEINGRVCMFYTVACAKLYRTEFLNENNIRFSEGVRLDDLDFTLHCNALTDRIVPVHFCGYKYRYNPVSISSTAFQGGMIEKFPYESLEKVVAKVVSTPKVDKERFEFALIKMIGWYGLTNAKDATLNDIKKYCSYCKNLLQKYFPVRENYCMKKEILNLFPISTKMGILLFYYLHKSVVFPCIVWLITKVV